MRDHVDKVGIVEVRLYIKGSCRLGRGRENKKWNHHIDGNVEPHLVYLVL